MKIATKRIVIVLLTAALAVTVMALGACALLGEIVGGNEYTITFVADGVEVATKTYSDRDKSVSEPWVPYKKGYTGAWEPYTLHQSKSMTVNAVYTIKTFHLSFNYNGGERDANFDGLTITYGQIVEALPQTSLLGYKFAGWYYENEYVAVGEPWKFDGDSNTIVAQWRKAETYKVSFYVEGSFLTSVEYDADDLVLYYPEPVVPKKTGYDGKWEAYTLTPTSGNIRVNAVYTIKTFVVDLDYDGATGGNTQQTVTITYNARIGQLPTPVKDGYAFRGWYVGQTRMDPGYTQWKWDDDELKLKASWWDCAQGTEGLRYQLNADGNSYTVTGIEMPAYTLTELDIPLLHDGKPVTAVAEDAFRERTWIQAINIGNNVKEIGVASFWLCSNVTSLTLGSGVTAIGSSTFYLCDKLTSVYYAGNIASWCAISFGGGMASPLTTGADLYIDGNLVTSVTLPDSVTSVGDYVFGGWKSLQSITLHGNLKTIGRSSFEDCSGLTSVDLPEGLTTIGRYAFAKCALASVDIPNSVTTIGEYAFYDCGKLTSVTLPQGIKEIATGTFRNCGELLSVEIPQSVTKLGGSAFFRCAKLQSVTIPQSVKSIGSDCFNGCSTLDGVQLPDDLTELGGAAFYACSALSSIDIPTGITEIGSLAFGECSSLTSVVIPSNVTTVGASAFYRCTGLQQITLGSGILTVKDAAFFGCSGLKNVYYLGDVAGWCGIEFEQASSNPISTGINLYIDGQLATRVVIPNSVTKIGSYNFYQCFTIESVRLGDGITAIAEKAFYHCVNLSEVIMGSNVTVIGTQAFSGCSRLASVMFNEGLETIGINAFEGCTALKTVTLPNSVTTLQRFAFQGSGLTSATLGNGVTTLDSYVFSDCTSLVSVRIGNGVEVLNSYVFSGCTSLANVDLGNGMTSVNKRAFDGCTGLISITLPDSITTLDESAFVGCSNLTTVNMSSNILSISINTFEDCDKLQFNIDGMVKYLGNSDNPYLVAMGLRTDNYNIRLNSRTRVVADYAFYRNYPAFPLDEEDFGSNLVAIGKYAFYYNNLQAIKLPVTLKRVEMYAFAGCSWLSTITYGGTREQWNEIQLDSSWNRSVNRKITVVCTNGDIEIPG